MLMQHFQSSKLVYLEPAGRSHSIDQTRAYGSTHRCQSYCAVLSQPFILRRQFHFTVSFIAHNFPESVALAAAFAVLFVDAFARKVAHFGEAGTIWLLPSDGGLYRGLSGVFGEKAASGVERGVAAKGGRSGGQGE